ncbi:hypothetical protein C0995_013015, partial [Termitomyces sp. Mi166
AGPSTAQIVLSSAPKPTAAAPVSKSAPVKSAGKPTVKGGSIFKDPFMVSNKDDNDEVGNDNEDDNEGGKANDDNNAAMDVDSGNLNAKILKMLCPEVTWLMVPTKVMVTEDAVP